MQVYESGTRRNHAKNESGMSERKGVIMDNKKIKELEGEIVSLKSMLLKLMENTEQLARFMDRIIDVVNGLVEREQKRSSE